MTSDLIHTSNLQNENSSELHVTARNSDISTTLIECCNLKQQNIDSEAVLSSEDKIYLRCKR